MLSFYILIVLINISLFVVSRKLLCTNEEKKMISYGDFIGYFVLSLLVIVIIPAFIHWFLTDDDSLWCNYKDKPFF